MAEPPDKPPTQKAGTTDLEPEERLTVELRRRGLSDAEIAATLRKKRRRKALEFDIVKSRHLVAEPRIPKVPKRAAREREPRGRLSGELCTVAFVAKQLKLHPKTVLRFIREGRLRGRRVGKAYRILRSDLEAFAGLPADAAPLAADASVTSIIDIPGVDETLARRWSRNVSNVLSGRPAGRMPVRAEVIHTPERAHLKIVVTGSPIETINLLSLIRLWLDQIGPR